MKLKKFLLLTLLAGMLLLIIAIIVPVVAVYIYTSQNGSIGIIGGADGPTNIYLTFNLMRGEGLCAIILGITLIVSSLFCLVFSKTVKNNCSIKTSVLSLGLSAVGAAGLVSFFLWFAIVAFGEMSKYPIEYPLSIILGILCFIVFIALIAIYIKVRKTSWSIKGFIIDVLTSIVCLPAFFFIFSQLYELLG